MTSSFWCLHCKHQTQSTPCFSAFNANPEHETTVLVYLYIYIHRNARPVDENEDNWTVTMALGFIVFVIKQQTSLTSSSYIFITDLEQVNILQWEIHYRKPSILYCQCENYNEITVATFHNDKYFLLFKAFFNLIKY